jgi:uncharacterized Tic20 family protein
MTHTCVQTMVPNMVRASAAQAKESFDAFIDRHLFKIKVIWIIYVFVSLITLGAGIGCVLRYGDSVKGCSETLIAGVCGTLGVVMYCIVCVIICAYDACNGRRIDSCPDYP